MLKAHVLGAITTVLVMVHLVIGTNLRKRDGTIVIQNDPTATEGGYFFLFEYPNENFLGTYTFSLVTPRLCNSFDTPINSLRLQQPPAPGSIMLCTGNDCDGICLIRSISAYNTIRSITSDLGSSANSAKWLV